jgi:hypothetical protein
MGERGGGRSGKRRMFGGKLHSVDEKCLFDVDLSVQKALRQPN